MHRERLESTEGLPEIESDVRGAFEPSDDEGNNENIIGPVNFVF